MAKKFWIADAIKHKGALTAKAKHAGKSPMAFAKSHEGDSGTTGKQARLAKTLASFRKKKKGKATGNDQAEALRAS